MKLIKKDILEALDKKILSALEEKRQVILGGDCECPEESKEDCGCADKAQAPEEPTCAEGAEERLAIRSLNDKKKKKSLVKSIVSKIKKNIKNITAPVPHELHYANEMAPVMAPKGFGSTRLIGKRPIGSRQIAPLQTNVKKKKSVRDILSNSLSQSFKKEDVEALIESSTLTKQQKDDLTKVILHHANKVAEFHKAGNTEKAQKHFDIMHRHLATAGLKKEDVVDEANTVSFKNQHGDQLHVSRAQTGIHVHHIPNHTTKQSGKTHRVKNKKDAQKHVDAFKNSKTPGQYSVEEYVDVFLDESTGEEYYIEFDEETMTEAKFIIRVNSRGKRTRKLRCPAGKIVKSINGRKVCQTRPGKEKLKKKLAVRRANRTKKSKGAGYRKRSNFKRQRAMRKRSQMGL